MKKRLISGLLIVVMLCSFIPAVTPQAYAATYSGTCGDDIWGDNLWWELDSETGVLTISGTGKMKSYGYPTYGTPAPWYSHRNSIKSIVINDGVESIGSYAFHRCVNLTDVSISDSVTLINSNAFCECTGLVEITIPQGVQSVWDQAFFQCTNLKNVTFSEGLQRIGGNVFYKCENLDTIIIPPTVTSISQSAFGGCGKRVFVLNSRCSIGTFNWPSGTLGNSRSTVIYGYSGSTASSFAEENGFEFRTIGSHDAGTCEHYWYSQIAVNSTCTEYGVLMHTCLLCLSSQTESIDPVDHNFVDGVCIMCGIDEVADTLYGFNSFFVNNYYNNINQLYIYESAAEGIVNSSSNFQINWNTYLSGLSNEDFINLSELSYHPEYYYETVLLESIMQTKLNDEYISALTSQISTLTIDALSYYAQYDANFNNYDDTLKQKLNDTMVDFSVDSAQYKHIKDYYERYTSQLGKFEVVKDIYDLTVEMNGSVEDFFNALSNYAGIRQASDEIIAALNYLQIYLERSTNKEDKLILTAVNNILSAFTTALDRQLLITSLNIAKEQLWNIFYSTLEIALPKFSLTYGVSNFTIDSALTLSNVLFPTSISSDNYCKIYADYSIECVARQALNQAYIDYSNNPEYTLADTIVGIYDLLGYTYKHEIEVANVLSKQLHKDGLLNGLKNLFFGRNMERYEYEQACILSYNAYLNDILKGKVKAQEEYGLAIGAKQPVTTVYYVNGKIVLCNQESVVTGSNYAPFLGELNLPGLIDLKFKVDSYYIDEAMTIKYDKNTIVTAPLSLYCNVSMTRISDGTPVWIDHSTGISVTHTDDLGNTILFTQTITEGDNYNRVAEYFNGAEFDLYDISLIRDGVSIQPYENVYVEIPVSAEHAKAKWALYRIESDGSFTEIDAKCENQRYQFSTSHFSLYAIVYRSANVQFIYILIALILLCGGLALWYFVVRKKVSR